MQKILTKLIIILAVCSFHFSAIAQQNLIELTVKDINLEVEYADTLELRNKGLMFRKSLCEQCGMLFKFDSPKYASMWMKNTFLPLDVAFVTAEGVISDVKQMEPHDLTPISASQLVVYALEMNQGWFAKHQVKVGDKLLLSKSR
jgi:uncharacterized membrane protein (UPF0127 family)